MVVKTVILSINVSWFHRNWLMITCPNEIFKWDSSKCFNFTQGKRSTYFSSGKCVVFKTSYSDTMWRLSYSNTICEVFFPDLLHLNASTALHQTWKLESWVSTDGFVASAQINFIEKIKVRSVDHADLLWKK